MSGTRYLEIDSTFRNRNQYPLPGSFVVEISQGGQQGNTLLSPSVVAKDPVSYASPLLYWTSSFNESTASSSVTVTGVTTTFSTTDPYVLVITGAQNTFRKTTNYYNGAVISLSDNAVPQVTVRRRITSYKLTASNAVDGDVALITVCNALPDNFPFGGLNTGTIQNSTNNTSTAVVPLLFIPSGSSTDNYYVNYTVTFYNPNIANPLSTAETRTITAYDGTTHLATLSSTTTTTWSGNNYDFVLRKNVPILTGSFIYPINSTTNTVQLATTASSVSGTYTGSFLRMITPVPINTALYSTNQSSYATETKIANYIAGDGTITVAILAGTTTSFTLNSLTSSNIDNYYVGGLLTLDYGLGTEETLLVTSYNGTTHVGTVASNWANNHANGASWTMRTAVLQNAITLPVAQAPQTTNQYEIEQFSKDVWNPFNYNGSLVSSQESVCYDVELINLVLPNSTLATGKGSRAIFYPYFYVTLQPISAVQQNKGIIYSNNPNAYKMVFRCVSDDTTQPVYSPFVKLDSGGMSHTMKYKPNDSFLVETRLPDGTVFQTVATDHVSPSEPNPLVQISYCFSFKRSAQ